MMNPTDGNTHKLCARDLIMTARQRELEKQQRIAIEAKEMELRRYLVVERR
jgi:hypothetical protein